jgi:hypothetical protein
MHPSTDANATTPESNEEEEIYYYHYHYQYHHYCYNNTIISIPDRAAEDEEAVAGGVDGTGPAEVKSPTRQQHILKKKSIEIPF